MTTPNPQRGEEKLVLGEVELALVPTFARLSKVESALGRSVVALQRQIEQTQDLTLTDVATAVYLLAGEPKAHDRNRIGGLLVTHGLPGAVLALWRVFARALTGTVNVDDEEEDPGKESPPPESDA